MDKYKILLTGLGILLFIVSFIALLSLSSQMGSSFYKFDELEEFCKDSDMDFEIYMNGDKFCVDSDSMYPVRYSNETFKFVIRGKHDE